jgi:gas vesicle protein
MSQNNNGDLGAFLAGFVIGGLVGAATALLLAPQSGPETRSQIVSRGQSLRHAGEEKLAQARHLADEYTHEYRDRAGELLAETRVRAHDVTDSAQEQMRIVLDAGKKRAEEARKQVEELRHAEESPGNENEGSAA